MKDAAENSAPDASAAAPPLWWQHPGLRPVEGRLRVAGRDAEALARFRAFGSPGGDDAIGLDVCSPGEVEHGLAHGFLPSELSYTGTNVSERDLDVILRHGVHMNLDLISQVHRYGRRAPGTAVGLRVNPRVSAVDPTDTTHAYSGERPTKFGVYPERLDEAVAAARSHDLTVDTVHVHLAHELRTPLLGRFEEATAVVAGLARRLLELGCPLAEVNMGGGLAAPTTAGGLDLDAYAAILARHLGPLGVTVAVEPGEYFSTDAAVLLAEVVTVEDRSRAGDGSAVFAGLDCGWNVMNGAFVYHEPADVVLCRAADAPATRRYTVTGHINEGPDIFVQDAPLPTLEEGDIVALTGVGSYFQAAWHTHCLRPYPGVLYLDDRLPA